MEQSLKEDVTKVISFYNMTQKMFWKPSCWSDCLQLRKFPQSEEKMSEWNQLVLQWICLQADFIQMD